MTDAHSLRHEDVDIRLAVTDSPYGESAVKVLCPKHRDKERSMCVYPGNIHCNGCGFHIKRRYEALAFLLGYWDGEGDGYDGAKRAMGVAHKYYHVNRPSAKQKTIEPLAPTLHLSYQMALWTLFCHKLEYFQCWRGLHKQIIKDAYIGYDGMRWVIPVLDAEGKLITLRYRRDDAVDTESPKYSGVKDYNQTHLYPMHLLARRELNEIWLVEGELDALSLWGVGVPAATVTNGAGQAGVLPRLLEDFVVAHQLQCRHDARPVYVIATDKDDAGRQAQESILSGLRELGLDKGCAVAEWGGAKDISEYLVFGGRLEDVQRCLL